MTILSRAWTGTNKMKGDTMKDKTPKNLRFVGSEIVAVDLRAGDVFYWLEDGRWDVGVAQYVAKMRNGKPIQPIRATSLRWARKGTNVIINEHWSCSVLVPVLRVTE